MFTSMFGAVEAGVIFAIMALGVYLTFRILDFPDLTVDGSFVTGAAIAAMLIVSGTDHFIATLAALGIGFVAGSITGVLHTKGKINPLLSGILMMIALYSINLRIMDKKSNVPLRGEETIFTKIEAWFNGLGINEGMNRLLEMIGLGNYTPKTWSVLFLMIIVTLFVKVFVDWFLKTEIGLALRATGDNQRMIRSFSANTDYFIILGLGISNALVATSGALFAQYTSFADIGMGIGMIVIGLASVIIGEAIVGTKTLARATLAVIIGAVIYRIVLALALQIDFFDTGDMKLITASIVIIALIIPRILQVRKEQARKKKRMQDHRLAMGKEGEDVAAIK